MRCLLLPLLALVLCLVLWAEANPPQQEAKQQQLRALDGHHHHSRSCSSSSSSSSEEHKKQKKGKPVKTAQRKTVPIGGAGSVRNGATGQPKSAHPPLFPLNGLITRAGETHREVKGRPAKAGQQEEQTRQQQQQQQQQGNGVGGTQAEAHHDQRQREGIAEALFGKQQLRRRRISGFGGFEPAAALKIPHEQQQHNTGGPLHANNNDRQLGTPRSKGHGPNHRQQGTALNGAALGGSGGFAGLGDTFGREQQQQVGGGGALAIGAAPQNDHRRQQLQQHGFGHKTGEQRQAEGKSQQGAGAPTIE